MLYSQNINSRTLVTSSDLDCYRDVMGGFQLIRKYLNCQLYTTAFLNQLKVRWSNEKLRVLMERYGEVMESYGVVMKSTVG